MSEILNLVRSSDRVLDLASGSGSFAFRDKVRLLVQVDLDWPEQETQLFIQADAHHLPIRAQAFDVVIAAHCLEHFNDPVQVLSEIARALTPEGLLFISVPDSSTFTDKLYRWIYDGGGHVNRFDNFDSLVAMIQAATGLSLFGARRLHSSFPFLTRTSRLRRGRRYLFMWATPLMVSISIFTISLAERLFRRQCLEYGWELYFGSDREPLVLVDEPDVCCACGAGHSDDWLAFNQSIQVIFPGFSFFHCPTCGQLNLRRLKAKN